MKLTLVVFDGVQALDVAGPLDVFTEANLLLPKKDHYEMTLVGERPGFVVCSSGIEFKVHVDYPNFHSESDLLLVAGGPRLPDYRPEPPLHLAEGPGARRRPLRRCLQRRVPAGARGAARGTRRSPRIGIMPNGCRAIPRLQRPAGQDLRPRWQPVHLRRRHRGHRPVPGAGGPGLGPRPGHQGGQAPDRVASAAKAGSRNTVPTWRSARTRIRWSPRC
jgi:hypothetical protein